MNVAQFRASAHRLVSASFPASRDTFARQELEHVLPLGCLEQTELLLRISELIDHERLNIA